MHKTTVVVDDEVIEQAAEILGTKGIKQTVDAALHEVLVRYAREHLIETHVRGMDFEVAAHLDDIERARIEGDSDWRRFLPT
ncbi:MAG: type II toxin-antitoxin system VapB family antitoxin [Chloroflexota bacterium]